MDNKKSNLDEILTKNELLQLEQMVNDFKKNPSIELEVSFRNINYSNYMRIVEFYVNSIDDPKKISSSDSLDISVILPNDNSYRVSIYGVDLIDKFIQTFSKAPLPEILKYVTGLKASDDVETMFKDRGSANRIYLEDFNLVFKTTLETKVKSNLTKEEISNIHNSNKVFYRYKQRNSFSINPDVRVDITEAKESRTLADLSSRNSIYDVELEVTNPKISTDRLLQEVLKALSVVQESELPVGKKEVLDVLEAYRKLLGIKRAHHLDMRIVVSIEPQHIIKFIPNRYAVTDKADGERYMLFSTEQGVYLISTNFYVKKLDLEITNKKFQNMILDGELIKNDNGQFFMVFDVVYANNVDYRTNTSFNLTKRIEVMNQIIKDCFQTLIPFDDYTSKHKDFEIDKIRDYYLLELKKYWTLFKKVISKNTPKTFITRKIYLVPYGIDPSEVFMYADILWKFSVYENIVPYALDGIIYTPINNPYMIQATLEDIDKVPMEYKWKTPMKNSIDFYIQFVKDVNGLEAVFYDNSVVRGSGNAYKICKLYVGTTRDSQEKPIPFKVGGKEQTANIYLVDSEARDVGGRVIDNDTVVEFIFDSLKADIDDAYKWIPLKTRYDKTESVQKFRKKYGNNLNVAIRIWKTIINPVTEEIIASLGNASTFQKEMERLARTKESYSKQNFVYYQLKSDAASGMRSFNNWIKSNMIGTYGKNKRSSLDIGCGRGGDLIKFVHAGVREYVGVDIDNNGLYVINNSAFKRYKNLKRTIKDVPPMYFINADAKAPFNVQAQQKIFPNMSESNKKLIEEHLSQNKKYDVISAQFTLHYYLSDELSWNNFCHNVRDHIEDNGYFIISTFDGKLIHQRLMARPKMTISYTDDKGNKNVFFDIVKIYNDTDPTGLGLAIDVYNSLILNPGTYIREYLVFPEFLTQSLKAKCGLELVETDSFFNLFNLYKGYFTKKNVENFVENTSAKGYNEIRDFYMSVNPDNHNSLVTVDQTDLALASFKLSMLNRYYVFKKTSKVNLSEPSRIVGINHQINMGKVIMPYMDSNRMIINPNKKNAQINKVYQAIIKKYKVRPSVYLMRHSIVEDKLDDDVYRRNKTELLKVKEGSDPKVLLIYKSPEKYFYPVYYKKIQSDDLNSNHQGGSVKKSYLMESPNVIRDLEILAKLTEKLK